MEKPSDAAANKGKSVIDTRKKSRSKNGPYSSLLVPELLNTMPSEVYSMPSEIFTLPSSVYVPQSLKHDMLPPAVPKYASSSSTYAKPSSIYTMPSLSLSMPSSSLSTASSTYNISSLLQSSISSSIHTVLSSVQSLPFYTTPPLSRNFPTGSYTIPSTSFTSPLSSNALPQEPQTLPSVMPSVKSQTTNGTNQSATSVVNKPSSKSKFAISHRRKISDQYHYTGTPIIKRDNTSPMNSRYPLRPVPIIRSTAMTPQPPVTENAMLSSYHNIAAMTKPMYNPLVNKDTTMMHLMNTYWNQQMMFNQQWYNNNNNGQVPPPSQQQQQQQQLQQQSGGAFQGQLPHNFVFPLQTTQQLELCFNGSDHGPIIPMTTAAMTNASATIAAAAAVTAAGNQGTQWQNNINNYVPPLPLQPPLLPSPLFPLTPGLGYPPATAPNPITGEHNMTSSSLDCNQTLLPLSASETPLLQKYGYPDHSYATQLSLPTPYKGSKRKNWRRSSSLHKTKRKNNGSSNTPSCPPPM